MLAGKIKDVVHPYRFVLDTLLNLQPKVTMAVRLRAAMVLFPRGWSEQFSRVCARATEAEIIIGKRQCYLVMTCADGIKRSFGEGTKIEYTNLAA